MRFGKKKVMEPEEVIMEDPTAWMLDNVVSEFLLMPGGVLYMCMFGYTFLHGERLYLKGGYFILNRMSGLLKDLFFF